MKRSLFQILSLATGLAFTAVAHSHSHKEGEHDNKTSGGSSLFQATFLGNYDYTTGHVIQLAQAIPADKYNWSPAEGVRSVEKAVLHIAAANYMLGSKLGATLPDGLDPMSIESKAHNKDAAIKVLTESIAFAKGAINKLAEDQLGNPVELFGMQLNNMSVVLIIGGHANEHLGQLIAYARSIGVTPPWSE